MENIIYNELRIRGKEDTKVVGSGLYLQIVQRNPGTGICRARDSFVP